MTTLANVTASELVKPDPHYELIYLSVTLIVATSSAFVASFLRLQRRQRQCHDTFLTSSVHRAGSWPKRRKRPRGNMFRGECPTPNTPLKRHGTSRFRTQVSASLLGLVFSSWSCFSTNYRRLCSHETRLARGAGISEIDVVCLRRQTQQSDGVADNCYTSSL